MRLYPMWCQVGGFGSRSPHNPASRFHAWCSGLEPLTQAQMSWRQSRTLLSSSRGSSPSTAACMTVWARRAAPTAPASVCASVRSESPGSLVMGQERRVTYAPALQRAGCGASHPQPRDLTVPCSMTPVGSNPTKLTPGRSDYRQCIPQARGIARESRRYYLSFDT